MTLRIHFLNYEAGTCDNNISVCTTSFTNIQNIPSKINIDQEVHPLICLFKDFQRSIQQCQDSKRYSGTCIYICHFSDQTIGFKTQNFNTSITGFITTKIIIHFQSSILLAGEEMGQAFFKR